MSGDKTVMQINNVNSEGLKKILFFRKQMKSPLDDALLTEFWPSISVLGRGDSSRENLYQLKKQIVLEKAKILKRLMKFGIVKYVGISGSVAAGTYKGGEDIDLFIVSANDSAWIVRFYSKIFTRGGRTYGSKELRNSLCINFIVEERALTFSESVFYAHEIIHLLGVWNEDYKQEIISNNLWLAEYIDVDIDVTSKTQGRNVFLGILNAFLFILQVFYMAMLRHKPNYKRLFENYKKGTIEFFPMDFHDEKVEAYKRVTSDLN